MIKAIPIILALSGCTTLEKVSLIPDIAVQSKNTTQEYVITQDKTKIEAIQDKDPVVISKPEVGGIHPIFYFLLYILVFAGITTLSLKEFNVKKKEDNGS